MNDIQHIEDVMEQKSENKCKPSELIEGFLQQGAAESGKSSGKTPRVTDPEVAVVAASVPPVTPRNLQSL